MTEYKIKIAVKARRDIREIHTYVVNKLQENSIADNLISKIETEILSLKNMPLRYALEQDEQLKNRNLRKIIMDNYLIFYTVREKSRTVFIVRVLYARRDWVNLL